MDKISKFICKPRNLKNFSRESNHKKLSIEKFESAKTWWNCLKLFSSNLKWFSKHVVSKNFRKFRNPFFCPTVAWRFNLKLHFIFTSLLKLHTLWKFWRNSQVMLHNFFKSSLYTSRYKSFPIYIYIYMHNNMPFSKIFWQVRQVTWNTAPKKP